MRSPNYDPGPIWKMTRFVSNTKESSSSGSRCRWKIHVWFIGWWIERKGRLFKTLFGKPQTWPLLLGKNLSSMLNIRSIEKARPTHLNETHHSPNTPQLKFEKKSETRAWSHPLRMPISKMSNWSFTYKKLSSTQHPHFFFFCF